MPAVAAALARQAIGNGQDFEAADGADATLALGRVLRGDQHSPLDVGREYVGDGAEEGLPG
jgi:hypothetical protein